MDSQTSDFNVESLLPPNIRLKSAANHFYRTGLSLFTFVSEKRNRFHNPIFVTITILVQILKSIAAILMKEEKYSLLLIGDFAYFIKSKNFINLGVILWGSLALVSQLIHYWKYYKNQSPSYLKPFEMMSGLVSPKSIGLTDKEDINKLLKRSKMIIKFSKFLIFSTCFTSICVYIPLFMNCTIELFPVETLWVLFFTLFTYFSNNFNIYQMIYFYIICYYLKIKLRNANNYVRKIFGRKMKVNRLNIKNILHTINAIHREINEYNTDYWSIYLMIVIMLIIIGMDIVLFHAIFGKIGLLFKVSLFYGSCFAFMLVMVLINTASSVSFESNKSYKLLNKLFLSRNISKISLTIRIKVWIHKIQHNLFQLSEFSYL